MNYRGFGTSDGKPSEAALVPDAVVVIKAELRTFNVAHGEFLSHQPVWEAVDEFLASAPWT